MIIEFDRRGGETLVFPRKEMVERDRRNPHRQRRAQPGFARRDGGVEQEKGMTVGQRGDTRVNVTCTNTCRPVLCEANRSQTGSPSFATPAV